MSTTLKVFLGLVLVTIFVNVLAPAKTYIVKAEGINLQQIHYTFSQQDVKDYVIAEAKREGIDPVHADWIISHESKYCKDVIGDNGISIGCWQFNLKANPQLSRKCVEDLLCSTQLALSWIKDGKINLWSTWRFRHIWYDKEGYVPD